MENYSFRVLESLYKIQKIGVGCDFIINGIENSRVRIHSFLLSEITTKHFYEKEISVSLDKHELMMFVEYLYTGKLFLSIANIGTALFFLQTC